MRLFFLFIILSGFLLIGCEQNSPLDPTNDLGNVTFAKRFSSALSFNGENAYVSVPHNSSLNLTNSFTIAAWIKIYEYTEWASIVTKGFNNNNFTIHQSGPVGGSEFGHLRFTGNNPNLPNWPFIESNTRIELGKWHHVTIMFDESKISFYLDGKYDGGGTLVGDLQSNDEPLFLGVDFPGVAEYWNGCLDDIMIWNTALKSDDISKVVEGKIVPSINSLVGFWRFNEGSGDTVHDKSFFHNYGLIYNAIWISPGAPKIF